MMLQYVLVPFALVASMGIASAADWYVDAVNGDDANSGTSPLDAWRTISHAIASSSGTDTVHVARGVYDTALGEVFPLAIENRRAIVGTGGSAATVVRGNGSGSVFSGCCANGPSARLEGLTLLNAQTGVRLDVEPDDNLYVELVDLVIEDMGSDGLYLFTQWGRNEQESASLYLTMERVRATNCGNGLAGRHHVYDGTMEVIATGCDLSHNFGTGIDLRSGGAPIEYHGDYFPGLDFYLVRSRVVGNSDGVDCYAGGYQNDSFLSLSDYLIAQNQVTGVTASLGGEHPHFSEGHLVRCIVVYNGVGANLGCAPDVTAESCIFYGNSDDLSGCISAGSLTNCDVGDGDEAGTNGNFSLNPKFVDPTGGDYRLRFASPCIDYVPSFLPGEDLLGMPRTTDGDLDTIEWTDVGAIEHAPLFVEGEAALGQTVRVELWGPEGGFAVLLRADGPTVPPIPTPFGEFELDKTTLRILGLAPTAPGLPGTAPLEIPSDPTMVDHSFSLQALTTSTVASPPVAFTNAVTLTIVP